MAVQGYAMCVLVIYVSAYIFIMRVHKSIVASGALRPRRLRLLLTAQPSPLKPLDFH